MTKDQMDAFLLHVDGPVKIEIPFIQDLRKRTALDVCLDVRPDEIETDSEKNRGLGCINFRESIGSMCCGDKGDSDEQITKNYMLADVLLENIKDYS